MYEAYKTLTDNSIKAYSVKTDCLTLHEDDLDKVCVYRFCRVWRQGLLKFGFDIGDWRMEETKTITIPTQLYTYKTNVLPDIPRDSNMSIEVEDEWDTKTICEIKWLRNPLRIRGKFPGMGESYTGEHFQQMGTNVIFVVPTDRLYKKRMWKQQPIAGFSALLFMKIFGETLPVFDYYAFNVVVFDEIYMSNLYVLDKGKQFIKDNPDILLIGNG